MVILDKKLQKPRRAHNEFEREVAKRDDIQYCANPHHRLELETEPKYYGDILEVGFAMMDDDQ